MKTERSGVSAESSGAAAAHSSTPPERYIAGAEGSADLPEDGGERQGRL